MKETYSITWSLKGGSTYGNLTGTNKHKLIRDAAAIIKGYNQGGRISGNFIYKKTDLLRDLLTVSKSGRVFLPY